MKISSISNLQFQGYIKIPLKDKSMGDGRLNLTPMDKVFYIADLDKAGIFVSNDIFILSASDKIKKALDKNEIEYEEVDGID